MRKYSQQVIEKIREKTGLAQATVYKKIGEAERLLGVQGNVAALYVAEENNIPIKRVSTGEERELVSKYRNQSMPARAFVGDAAKATAIARAQSRKNNKLPKPKNPKQVFLIHGRNAKLNSGMNSFLRSIGLQPIEFSTAIHGAIKKLKGGGNPFIGDILDVTFERVKALIVLFSPDDEVQLRKHLWSRNEKRDAKKLLPQARPNVIFEAGLAFGRHQEKTLFVSVGKIKPFSDIAGRHMLHLTNTSASRRDFALRLENMGCTIELSGNDWENEGDFSA